MASEPQVGPNRNRSDRCSWDMRSPSPCSVPSQALAACAIGSDVTLGLAASRRGGPAKEGSPQGHPSHINCSVNWKNLVIYYL